MKDLTKKLIIYIITSVYFELNEFTCRYEGENDYERNQLFLTKVYNAPELNFMRN
jgi:hypothetical protein